MEWWQLVVNLHQMPLIFVVLKDMLAQVPLCSTPKNLLGRGRGQFGTSGSERRADGRYFPNLREHRTRRIW